MLNLTKSNLRSKLLGLYFSNTDASYYVRELAKILRTDPTNLSRELSRLEKQGLFVSEEKGKQKFYKLNKHFPTFRELKRIINKTIGAIGVLRAALTNVSGIKLALLYGSFAEGREDAISDIDVFIVSDEEPEVFYNLLPDLEKKLGREINLSIYSTSEYARKRKTDDPFLRDILKNKYEILSGEL